MMVTMADPAVTSLSQHGAVCQVPARFRSHPIASIVRNPYDRFRSLYYFRWWATHCMVPDHELRQLFPDFPALTLAEVHDLHMQELRLHTPGVDAGYQTVYFVRMYARNPRAVLSKLSDDYIDSGRWRADFANVEFLTTDGLRQQLPEYLVRNGFEPGDVEVIATIPPENVSSKTGYAPWRTGLVEQIAYDERWLFRMLEQLGHSFKRPVASDSSTELTVC
jgi:hypothetical protein